MLRQIFGGLSSSFMATSRVPFNTTTGSQSISGISSLSGMMQKRFIRGQYGSEYQPSIVKRKRTHGFLRRLMTRNGRRLLWRRKNAGQKYLGV
ncbi:hypothetical protein MIR68_000140 [Amoeboaphelidium protococcarum]|nr:hypothetical protein MIR68_000140 [Amoeboaphelidium protococcarum]